MAKLVILNQGLAGCTFELNVDRATVGSADDNTFQITDPSLSGRHCELLRRGSEIWVRDLNSTNGSFLNDEKITESLFQPGQILRLGFVELKLETAAAPPRIPAGSAAGSPVAGRPNPAATAARAGASNRGMSKVKLFILCAVILLGLVGAGIFILLPRSSSSAPSAGPVGRWKLDDGSGTVARDSSHTSPSHDGTLVNHPAWVQGRTGGALQFDGANRGANQYVSLGQIFPDGYTELSIACWVKHPSTSWQDIVGRSVWDDPDGISLNMDYFGTSVDFGHYDVHVKSKANVQDDQWHHLVGTLSRHGSEFVYSIYVDGKLDNQETNAEGLSPSANGWAIGARFNGSWLYQGLIADVRIYNRALSESEVNRIYEGKD